MWPALVFIFISGTFLYQLLKLYLGKNSDFWKKHGIPSYPNTVSILDIVTGRGSVNDLDTEIYNKIGDEKFGGSVELGIPILYVKDLELVKMILVKDFDNFVDRREVAHSCPLQSKNLFALEGQTWRDMRNFLSPTFTSGKIRRMFHHMDRSCKRMLQQMETKEPSPPKESQMELGFVMNVNEMLKKFTLEVIASAAFGMDVTASNDSNLKFTNMVNKLNHFNFERTVRFAVFQSFPKFADYVNLWSFPRDLVTYFQNVLSSAFRLRDSSTEPSNDFLQLLVEAKRGDNKLDENDMKELKENEEGMKPLNGKRNKIVLTESMAVAQAFVFLLGGFDSISNNLMIALYMLAAYPEIQEKVFEDIENVLETGNGEMNYEAVNTMEYLDMFVSEVLRLYPALTRIERKAKEDYKILNTDKVIPKGTIVALVAESFHRDEKYYPDPMKFDPERFNAENKAKRNPYAYMAFGNGPRNCIARRFALIETKVAIAQIVHEFKIEPAETTPIPPQVGKVVFGYRASDDLELRFVPRK